MALPRPCNFSGWRWSPFGHCVRWRPVLCEQSALRARLSTSGLPRCPSWQARGILGVRTYGALPSRTHDGHT